MDLIEFHGPPPRRHPWEAARRAFFSRELARAGMLNRPIAALDVGAGDAWFAEQIAQQIPDGSSIDCWDPAYAAAPAIAPVSPKIHLVARLPEKKFDLLLLMDVLEHVPADQEFLSTLVSGHLRPGGTALISVPAWPALFSSHDRRLKHFRRYTPSGARRLIGASGLAIVRAGGLFHSFLAVRALQKMIERWSRQAPPMPDLGEWAGSRWWTASLTGILGMEGRVSSWFAKNKWSFPGLSYWALCRKPS